MVEDDIRKLKPKHQFTKKDFEKGMEELEKRKDIIIRPADKGGGIVILKKTDYLKELDRLVENFVTYKKLTHNPTSRLKSKLEKLVKKAKENGILTKKEARYIIPEAPRLPLYRGGLVD